MAEAAAVFFRPVMKVSVLIWRDPETGRILHFEHEVTLDPRAKPVAVRDLEDLRRKLGSSEVICQMHGGRYYVFSRELTWDGAEGECPQVLGELTP